MEYSNDQRNEALRRLPVAVQDAVLSTGLFEAFRSIVAKHQLHIDQAGILSDELNNKFIKYGIDTDVNKEQSDHYLVWFEIKSE